MKKGENISIVILLIRSFAVVLFLVVTLFSSCKTDKGTPEFGSYPTDIGRLMTTKCATPGCHTAASMDIAGELSLATWNELFNGTPDGADVIPFRPDFSPLFFHTNIYPDLGTSLTPTMPYNKAPLSRYEVQLLKNWIQNGAPDASGFVKFSDNPLRKKIYVTNQGCDVVTVFDEETGLPMRYINVGTSPAIESPHMIRVSPDGKYWYVIFTAGPYVQRYRTSDDGFDSELNIGSYNWNSITISLDSKDAYVVDWSGSGHIAHINLQTMTLVTPVWFGSLLFEYPHGGAINGTNDTLYVTGQTGNYIYKIPVSDPASRVQVSIEAGQAPVTNSTSLNVHEIVFSPDFSKYFVTCQNKNEVRVIKTSNDSLLAIIPVGLFPQELSISKNTNYLFVSSPEDTISFPGSTGSIAVIDYTSNTLVTKIFAGFQPHGLVVDDAKHLVYVANRNITSKGPLPHHTGFCGGRNGYLTIIDMATMDLAKNDDGSEKEIEMSVDPYSIAIR
jgi:DNA-binding beta-propeller fold protein YncE